MGRISKVTMLQRKIKGMREQERKKALKPPFMCPICFNDVFYVEKKHGRLLVKAYCPICQLGELMPNHETFSIIDYYAFICDSWLRLNPVYVSKYGKQKDVPQFRFKSGQLTEAQLAYLKTHVSYGEIIVSP